MVLGSVFLLMIVGMVVLVSVVSPQVFAPPIVVTQQDDLREVNEFLGTDNMHVSAHPDFEQINQFVKLMASRLDDTSNNKIRKMIDHRRHWKEVSKRSTANFYYDHLSRSENRNFIESTSGPPSFANEGYEIIGIDQTKDGFRVALCYDYGYDIDSMFVWYLSDDKGRLLIYDWFNAELGMRESFEYGVLCDATSRETIGHDRHSEFETAYFNIDEDLEYNAFQREIRKYLKRTETYGGPKSLESHNQLIAAKRWAYHDEPIEAMRTIDNITSPGTTPGVFLVRANIHFENGLYKESVSAYEDYVKLVASSPYVEKQLIKCARKLGDHEKEKKLLASYCEHVSLNKSTELGALVELNSDSENRALFKKIDACENKKEIYSAIAGSLKFKTFYRSEFDVLNSHLKSTMPESALVRLAELTPSARTQTFIEVLDWLDSLDPKEAAKHRYNFWYAVPDAKMLAVFKASKKKELNFDEIYKYYRYEDYFPEGMKQICESTLEENPKSRDANGTMARLLMDGGEFENAVQRLNLVLNDMKEGDKEDEGGYKYTMLRALYENGDHEKAVAWAARHELTESLVKLKAYEEDFSDFESLLEQLDKESNEYKYQFALLKASRDESDAAAKDLIALIKDAEKDEAGSVDYRYKWQLKKILSKNKQLSKVVEAFPDEDRFWEIANEMITERDWDGCEKLLAIGEESLSDSQRALRLLLNWEQGKYESLAALQQGSGEIPKSAPNLNRILKKIVDSCIRQEDFENAEKWAVLFENGSRRNEVLASMELKKGNWKEAAARLRKMASSEKYYLPNRPWLWNDAAFDQPEIASLIPTRSVYYVEKDSDIELAFLFESAPELGVAALKKSFVPILGEDMAVEEFPASSDATTWKTFSNDEITIVVKQSSPRYKKPETRYKIEEDVQEIQEIFLKARSRMDVAVHSALPLSSAESMRLVDMIAKPICDLKPQLFGNVNSWLAPDKFEAWFAAKSKDEINLEASEDCQSVFAYPTIDIPKIEPDVREAFSLELGKALRDFLASSDPAKSFVVELDNDSTTTQLVIDVDRIERRDFGDVNLIGRPGYSENVPRIGLVRGDVSFSISEVMRFSASFDQKKIQRKIR